MLRSSVPLLLASLLAFPVAHAAGPSDRKPSAKALFVKPVVLRGTLGDAQIQAMIRTKEEFEDGVEGEYFVFGQSQRILLAGEIEADELLLEESENGTDVSGQWAGKLAAGVISGEWQSADGTITKPFTLHMPETAVKNNAAAGKMGRHATKQ